MKTFSHILNITTGTQGLKFHATIPITVNKQKIGLLNLLSQESRQLDDKELTILNTISELIGAAIQRTRIQQSGSQNLPKKTQHFARILNDVIIRTIDSMVSNLQMEEIDYNTISKVKKEANDLKRQLTVLHEELNTIEKSQDTKKGFSYPDTPLTRREMEVLVLIQQGLTNEDIGKRLYISERTVKFHITSLLSKLQAKNRTSAVDIALKRGLLGI